jgi:hypothetical protein
MSEQSTYWRSRLQAGERVKVIGSQVFYVLAILGSIVLLAMTVAAFLALPKDMWILCLGPIILVSALWTDVLWSAIQFSDTSLTIWKPFARAHRVNFAYIMALTWTYSYGYRTRKGDESGLPGGTWRMHLRLLASDSNKPVLLHLGKAGDWRRGLAEAVSQEIVDRCKLVPLTSDNSANRYASLIWANPTISE